MDMASDRIELRFFLEASDFASKPLNPPLRYFIFTSNHAYLIAETRLDPLSPRVNRSPLRKSSTRLFPPLAWDVDSISRSNSFDSVHGCCAIIPFPPFRCLAKLTENRAVGCGRVELSSRKLSERRYGHCLRTDISDWRRNDGRKFYFKIGTGVGNSSGTILNLIRVERIIIKPRLLIRFAGYGANYNRKESKRRMPLP